MLYQLSYTGLGPRGVITNACVGATAYTTEFSGGPGRKRPGKGWEPLTQYNDCWQFVIGKADLKPDEEGNKARVYDLRHSFATAGVGAGLSLPLIGKLLGHTQNRTMQRYAHVDDDPLREAVGKIADHIASAGKGGVDGDNVEKIEGGGPNGPVARSGRDFPRPGAG